MDFNLFQGITDPKSKFLKGTTPQPTTPTPSFFSQVGQPVQQKPVQPSVQKPSITLFSNERKAYDAIIGDGLSEEEAQSLVKKHRAQIAPDLKLNPIEQNALRQMASDGLSSQESIQLLQKARNMKEGEAKTAYDTLPWYDKLGLNTVGATMGALSTVGSSTENLLGWGAKKLGMESLGNSLQDSAKQWDNANEINKADPNFSAGTKTGNIIGGTAMMLSAPTVGGSASTMAGKIIGGATTGGFQMGATDIANKGETSLGSIATGVALGGGLPIVGKGLSKVGDYITERLPKILIAKGMTTPTALKNASERLSKLSDDGILNIDDAPQWMLDKGLKGSKDEIATTLQGVIKTATKTKGEMFAQNTMNYGKEAVTKDLQGALKEILPMFMKGKAPRAGSEQTVAIIKSMIQNKNVRVQDIDAMRSVIGDLGIFTKTGDMADSVAKEGLQKIWVNASKFLDDTLPGFRVANKDIEVAIALRKAIGLKEAQDATRSLLTLPNVTMGGLGAGVGYQQGGLDGMVKGLALGGLGIGAKTLINNPRFTTSMAQTLKNVGKGRIIKTLKNGVSGGSKKLIIPSISNLSGQEDK